MSVRVVVVQVRMGLVDQLFKSSRENTKINGLDFVCVCKTVLPAR